jgi:hypothetical protein
MQVCSTIIVVVLTRYNPMNADFDATYYAGLFRIGDYAIGLGLGYLLRKYQEKKFEISPVGIAHVFFLSMNVCLKLIRRSSKTTLDP